MEGITEGSSLPGMLYKTQDTFIIGPSAAFCNPLRNQIFPRAFPHFFFALCALILLFCNFFCRCGYFVAGFLGVRLAFLDMMLPFTLRFSMVSHERLPINRR